MIDTKHRRQLLDRHVGETVEIRREHIRELPADHAKLIDVKRTRAVVQFPNAPMLRVKSGPFGLSYNVPEQWTVPLDWLLLPGCLESDPRQQPLFVEA